MRQMPVIRFGHTQEGRQEQAPAVRCESESFDGLETFRLLGEEHGSRPVRVCGYGTANRGQQLVDRAPIIVESEGCGRDSGLDSDDILRAETQASLVRRGQ
jgi:hypothetical protein